MNRATKLVVVVFAVVFSARVTAGVEVCPPQPPWTQPVITDGALADEGEMVTTQNEVSLYVREIERWNTCNMYVHGLQSGRMLLRARAVANAYNVELGRFRRRDKIGKLSTESKANSVPSKN